MSPAANVGLSASRSVAGDLEDPMLLLMPGMENIVVWQALMRDSQCKPLGF